MLGQAEQDRILGAVDRSTPLGRRDYAVLLLAARYGLRPCDIRQLTLDDIHWRDGRIDLQTSGEALLAIINDILDFSKIEAGKLVIESFPFDLRLLIEEVAEMLAPRAEEKGLDLILQYEVDPIGWTKFRPFLDGVAG